MVALPGEKTAPRQAVEHTPAWRPRVPGLVAWVVRLAALTTFLDVMVPESRRPIGSGPMDAVGDGAAFAAAAVAAGVMLLLAGGLKRRKRRAWKLMVVVVSIGLAAHVHIHSWRLVVVYALVLGLLVWARRDFTALSERRSRRVALRVLLVMGGVSMLAGMLLTRHTAPGSSFLDRLVEVFFGLMGFAPQLSFREQSFSDLTQVALATLGGLTALLFLAALLAPAGKPARRDATADTSLRDLLARFGGRDSLGYFALRDDKTVVFSSSGKAAIAYRVLGGVSLASGDPLGDPEAWPGAIAAWLAEADRYAWVPGVIGASEEGAVAFRRAGLDALELGDEAVLDVSDFRLDGRSMRVVRQAVNRVRRAGYTLDVRRQADLGADELAETVKAADSLRGQDVERGFSMALNRLGDPRDPDLVVARAWDAEHRLVAVLCFVPWGPKGLSLDLMRRSKDSENGTVEFVVVGVAEQAASLGVCRLSLNFAVFRSVFERGARVGAGPVLRFWHRVLMLASRWWQIESLYRANAKYHPAWIPRFVCFRRAGDLPRVALAALEAEAFIVRPRLHWLVG